MTGQSDWENILVQFARFVDFMSVRKEKLMNQRLQIHWNIKFTPDNLQKKKKEGGRTHKSWGQVFYCTNLFDRVKSYATTYCNCQQAIP